jgi:hypothetical protein
MVTVKDAIERKSLDDFAELLAPDVVWVGLWPGELCRNRDDVLEMFGRMRDRERLLLDCVLDGHHRRSSL